MNRLWKKLRGKRAFTIVELLTVMAVIAMLLGLLVPALNKVRLHAKTVKQRAQNHSIEVALEMYKNEQGDYPPSSTYDPCDVPYNGALKLAEAMVGQDLLGQHVDSVFREDGNDIDNNPLYPANPNESNLDARIGTYVKLENANAYKLEHIYSSANSDVEAVTDSSTSQTADWRDNYVLCDVFGTVQNLGGGSKKIGMPILYFRADTRKKFHDANSANWADNIYKHYDNYHLLRFGLAPGSDANDHPLIGTVSVDEGKKFYEITKNENITTMDRPYNEDSFFLISAGGDSKYGTPDDIMNIPE